MKRFVILFFLFGCCSSVPAQDNLKRITLQLQWSAQTQFAGYYAALTKGFYKREGLHVSIRPGGVNIVPQDVVSSGHAEFCVAWLPKVLVSIEQGQDLVNIAQIFQRNGTLEISWKDSGIKSPGDWRGKKIGTWGHGNEIGLFAAMREVGMDPQNPEDVTIVQQTSDMNLFLERRIDAAQAMIYNEYFQVLQATNPETGKRHSPSDLVTISMEEIGAGMPQDGIYARKKWISENEDVAIAFLRASQKGWLYCRDNVEDCVDIVMAADPELNRERMQWMMVEVNKLIWVASSSFGMMEPDQWNHAAELLQKSGILKSAPPKSAYRTDLMRRATVK